MSEKFDEKAIKSHENNKIKYVDTAITFSEVPDEISLCINISNCPHGCKGCHSPYLQEDVGNELTTDLLKEIIDNNKGITCVCFMGGDCNLIRLYALSDYVHELGLKTAWYTGLDFSLNNMEEIVVRPIITDSFDYIKTGPYIESLGPLNKKTTNQKMYKKISEKPIKFEDITERFWK